MMNPKFFKKVAGILREVPAGSIPYDKITEVRMTGAEFYELFAGKNIAVHDVKWMSKKIEELEEAVDKLAKQKAELETTVTKAKKALKALQEELVIKSTELKEVEGKLAISENRNANLLRISREKANKDRGLPRKGNGYQVISARQVKQVVSSISGDRIDVVVWKTTFQTPYRSEMQPLENIEDLVLTDLFDGGLILPKMGCPLMNVKWQNGEYAPFLEDENPNAAFAWQFNCNFKTGFWEIDVFTKEELNI